MYNIQRKTEEEISVTLTIADRAYKMTISREEEESVMTSVKRINSELEKMEKVYRNKDKQDLLAMIALQNTNELLRKVDLRQVNSDLVERLEAIDNLVFENTGI